ncbi:MAG TPA: hypothetical protein VH497_07715 [Vicinamibacterales bacterium]|jgi:hypothetical protein
MGATWGQSPYSGVSINPFFAPQVFGPSAFPQSQIQQLLHTVPQQIQQLLQLQYLQQHQLQQLQQTIQFLPAQLAQLQQSQPYGTAGLPFAAAWGASPQMIGAQPSHVM